MVSSVLRRIPASSSLTHTLVGTMKLGFCHVLALMMFWLKATNQIDWSWWWVFSPILLLIGLEATGRLLKSIVEVSQRWEEKKLAS
jgi:phosphate/sulfate permease